MPFTKLLDVANLKSPFKNNTLEDVVHEISSWLDSVDVENLVLESTD